MRGRAELQRLIVAVESGGYEMAERTTGKATKTAKTKRRRRTEAEEKKTNEWSDEWCHQDEWRREGLGRSALLTRPRIGDDRYVTDLLRGKKVSGKLERGGRTRERERASERASLCLLFACSLAQLTYGRYFLGFLYMQILHYNNDFEIYKMCLRNWCARETTVTPMHSFPQSIWKLKHIHKPFFSIVTHFPPSFHNWQVQRLRSETDYVICELNIM